MISVESLSALKTSAEHYYRAMHTNMQRADALYKQKFTGNINLPENIEIFRSSRAATAIDDLRDQIRVDEPIVIAHPAGTGQRAKEQAALQEMWGRRVFRKLAEDSQVDPTAQVPFDLLLRGAACIKTLIKPEALRGRPEPKANESRASFNKRLKSWQQSRADLFPYHVVALDPLTVMPSPGLGTLKYVIEVQKRRVLDMWESYPNWTDPKARALSRQQRENPLREVEWVEYWSWYYNPDRDAWEGDYVVEVDGERIIEEPNVYGLVPYIWRYSGFGRANHDGDPADLAIGALTHITGELEQEILLKTAMSAQWQFHVFPRLKVKGMSAAEAARRFQKGPGAVIDLPPDGDVQWMDTPPPNETMFAFVREIENAIDRRISPALSGNRTADFGIHQALLLGQAIKIISPVKSALNYLGAELLDKLAALSERFDLTMNVTGTMDGVERTRTITARDFAHRSFEVRFEAVDPTENDRRMLALISVKRADTGLISRESIRRTVLKGIVDSNEEEEARIMAEQLQDQMVASGALLEIGLQHLAAIRDQASIQRAAQGLAQEARRATQVGAELVAGRERNIESLVGQGTLTEQRETAQAGLTQGGV